MTPNVPLPIDRALKLMGTNITKCRQRRRLTRREFAQQMGVSLSTAQRLEKGERGVALSVMVCAMEALGMLSVFNQLFDPASDDLGHMVQDLRLPKRVRHASSQDHV